MTITQMHLPVDDTRTYWYASSPASRRRSTRRRCATSGCGTSPLPDYLPKAGRHDAWGFDPEEQRTRTFLGMGEDDINVHDQWAVESMGAIQDRTREHLGPATR